MAGQAGRRRGGGHGASRHGASGDGAPAALSGTGWLASRLRPLRRVAAPVLGAGITATVLAGAMMAAGPAAASPATRAATAARSPISNAAARMAGPAARRFVTWGRAAEAGARAMSPQIRMSSAANSPGFSGGVLTGVSCTGRSQCTATGMASTRSGKNVKTLAERWNGTSWAVQSTPTPTSRTVLGGTLEGGVSCTSATACVADGFSYGSKSTQLLGEGWNGRTWSTQPDATPVVAGQAAGISCRWAKDCMAVGLRLSGMTLAEHWNGRRWSAVTTKHAGELVGVACPATGNCTAVGTNSGGKALAAHWNGKAWSDQSPARPQQLTVLGGVSCPATTGCVAVGTAGTETSSAVDLAPLAEQWTGGKWAALTVPDPAPAGDITELNSVSCTSATNCMAVGDYSDQAGSSDSSFAEQWNGTTWTIVTTPSPATFSRSCLCPAPRPRTASRSGAAAPRPTAPSPR